MSRWTWAALLAILVFDVWLRGHTFGPTLHARWGVNLWPENSPSATTEPLDCDEAAYAYMGRRMVAGDVLYRDLTENKPPLGYWLYALAVALGGADELTIRVLPVPYVLATIALLWWVALRVRGPLAACLAACVFAVASTDPFVYANGANMEHFINFFAVASLAALIGSWERPGRSGFAVAGGLLGAACLVKQVALIHLPVYALALAFRRGRGLGSRLVDGLWLVGGLVAVVTAAVLVIAVQGGARAAFEDVVVYGRAIAADAPTDPHAPSGWVRWLTGNADPKGELPAPFGKTGYLVWWGSGTWPLWVAGLVGATWLLVQPFARRAHAAPPPGTASTRPHEPGGPGPAPDQLIACWTLSACVQVVLPGMYWAHYYMLPLPGLALLAAFGFVDALRLARSPSWGARGAGACLAVLLGLGLAGTAVLQGRDYLGNAPEALARKYKGGAQWITLRDFGREIAARKRAWADPKLYVWGWQSPLLIYGGLDSVSRHFFADELIKTADQGFPGVGPATRRLLAKRTDDIMDDLRRRPPELVMAGHPPFPALMRFLHERYLPSGLDMRTPDGRGLWVERSRYGAFETARARR